MSEHTTSDALLTELLENLGHTRQHLQEMVRCLQHERESVTLFELEHFIHTVRDKQALIEELEALTQTRNVVCLELWRELTEEDEIPGDDLTTFLNELARFEPERGDQLRQEASHIANLLQTVRELQHANRAIVSRASRWVNQYLGQLLGSNGLKYNSRGQLATRSLSTLRRMA